MLAISGPKATTPEPAATRGNLATLSRQSPVSPAAAAQVAALRDALRHEQDEVARLRREVAKLTTQHERPAVEMISVDTPMAAPVTPDAAEKGPSGSSAMEISPVRTSPFDGFAAHWGA